MTAKELLIPRFEVIETYPKSNFKIGNILERVPNATNDWYNHNKSLIDAEILLEEIEKYPHLFRKMNWWEGRTKEQMPKKLVSLANKDIPNFDLKDEEVYDIIDWDMKHLNGIIDTKSRSVCSLTLFKPEYGYFPVD